MSENIARFIENVRKITDEQRRSDAYPLALQLDGENLYIMCVNGIGTPILLADALGDVPSPAYIGAEGDNICFGETARDKFFRNPETAARLSLHALTDDQAVCPKSDKPMTMTDAVSLMMKAVARDVQRKGYRIGKRLIAPIPCDLSTAATDRLRHAAQKAGLRLKVVAKDRAVCEYIKKKTQMPCERFLLVHFSADQVELSTVCCNEDEVCTNAAEVASYGYRVCDDALMAYLEDEFRKDRSFTGEIDSHMREEFLYKVRSVRKRLASKNDCKAMIDAGGMRASLTLTYEKLCEKTASAIAEVLQHCENMLRSAPTTDVFILGEGVQVTQLTDALEQKNGCGKITKLPEDAQACGALLYYLRTTGTVTE